MKAETCPPNSLTHQRAMHSQNGISNVRNASGGYSHEGGVAYKGSPETAGPSSRENDILGYQREVDFHARLKRAASLRRKLPDGGENGVSVGSTAEVTLASALDAAAKAFANPHSASRDEVFFDAAIDRVITTTVHSPARLSEDVQQSMMKGTEDWSLSEMLGILATRSLETIAQQQEEINCLRIVVRALMGEMLQKGGATHATRAAAHYSTPQKGQNEGGANPISRPVTTPSTGNSTVSDSSARTTPTANASYGPPYSSRAARRHEMAKELRIGRSGSGDSQDSNGAHNLKQVRRSLDPQMEEAEQQREVTVLSSSTPGLSSLSEWKKRHQTGQMPVAMTEGKKELLTKMPTSNAPSVEQSRAPEDQVTSDAGQNASLDGSRHGKIKRAIVKKVADVGTTRNQGVQAEKRHVGHIIESILDAIIDRSMDRNGEDSTTSTLMFPGLLPVSVEVDENSILNVGGSAETGSTSGRQSSRSVLATPKSNTSYAAQNGRGVKAGNMDVIPQQMGIVHSDPPALYMRMESRTLDDAGQGSLDRENKSGRNNLSETGREVRKASLERADSTGALEEEELFDDRNEAEHRGASDEESNAGDNNDQGERRMVVLISSSIASRAQHTDQERAAVILHANGIQAEFVDGADPSNIEIRESLFGVSGLRGVYPQFFLVEDDGMTEFFGEFQEIEQLNDAEELRSTFLCMSSAAPAETENEVENDRSYQEEKKDEHPTRSKPVRPMHLFSDDEDSEDDDNAQGEYHSQEPPPSDVPSSLAREPTDGVSSSEDRSPMMYIREENYFLMHPSPILNKVGASGKLPVIKEDGNRSASCEDGDSQISSQISSSLEVYIEEGSHQLRWV